MGAPIKLNAMIVENDTSLSTLISAYLEKNNCRTVCVPSAEKAMQLLNDEYYDLFVIDIKLDGIINGLQLLDHIKRDLNFSSEVVMISGFASTQNAVDAIKKGAFNLLEKPFPLSKLNELLDSVTQKKIIKRIPLNIMGFVNSSIADTLKKDYTILAIDDENDILTLLELLLKDNNYRILTAANVKEAEHILKTDRPDLILLDVMMPDEDGYSFGSRLKADERYFDIPIIMLSAKNRDEDIKKGIDLCADDYITKPFSATVLTSKIKAMLRMKNIIDEMKVHTNTLLQTIEKNDTFRKYLSKETYFFMQLNKTLNIGDKAELIKKFLPDILEIELFSMFLLNKNELHLFAHNHAELPKILKLDDMKNSPISAAIRDCKSILIEDFGSTGYYTGKTRSKYKKKSSIIIPLIIHNNVIGILNLNNRIVGEFDILFMERVSRTIEQIVNSIENCRMYCKMQEMAIIDELTKVYNRRHFFNLFDSEIKKFNRNQRAFSLLMIDIDNFKKFNDSYGHLNGDKILRLFAKLLKNSIRESDILARYGGEEFVILLSETDVENAKTISERIRTSVEKDCFIEIDGKKIGITMSGGLTEYKKNQTEEETLSIADDALYTSKHDGKNRITVFD